MTWAMRWAAPAGSPVASFTATTLAGGLGEAQHRGRGDAPARADRDVVEHDRQVGGAGHRPEVVEAAPAWEGRL